MAINYKLMFVIQGTMSLVLYKFRKFYMCKGV